MASISRSKTLFFFTSPRTPIKIVNEIRLLVGNFSGKKWDNEHQIKYYNIIADSKFFKGKIAKNRALAARDRINRAPKALGFVDLKPIKLTSAGKRLLSEKRVDEIFLRQLIKFQLPSYYHTDNTGRFKVKPYLELLRLIYDSEGLTKYEMAMFGMQLINIDMYEDIVNQLNMFRNEKSKTKYLKKKEFIRDYHLKIVKKIFEEEISSEKFNLRESNNKSLKKFIITKRQNMMDYADAAIRYLKVTGLVTYNIRTLKIEILPDKEKDVEFLLKNIDRVPESFFNENEFKEYLFDDENLVLLSDNKNLLINSINPLANELKDMSILDSVPDLNKLSILDLKDLRDEYSELKIKYLTKKQENHLKTYEDFDDILHVYDQIEKREFVDPPLIFEWNTWRAISMLNDGNIQGNFKIDTDGSPLFHAPGNTPDIQCEYDSFNMIVEVTLSTGEKQYTMEGETVARHLGKLKKNSNKAAFCLFIAKKLNDATLANFFIQQKTNVFFYGGKSRIIPFDLPTFIQFLSHAKDINGINSKQIHDYVCFLSRKTEDIEDEKEWFDLIKKTAPQWTKC